MRNEKLEMRNERDGRTGKEEREEERREMGEGKEGEIWRIEKAREGSMKEFNGIVICSTS